jgi:hypothetical protein
VSDNPKNWLIMLGILTFTHVETNMEVMHAELTPTNSQVQVILVQDKDTAAWKAREGATELAREAAAHDEQAEQHKKDLENRERQQEGLEKVVELLNEPEARRAEEQEAERQRAALEGMLAEEERAKAKSEIRADAEAAAAAIEKATDEVNKVISEAPKKSELEIEAIENEFEQKEEKRAGKLDKIADKYFKDNPDLSEGDRDDARDKFAKIKDDEMTKLEDQKNERLAELETRQQEQRENDAKRLAELERTRTER